MVVSRRALAAAAAWSALLAGDALVAHALASFGELAQQVLASKVAGAQHAGADGEVGAIAPEPPARSGYHSAGWRVGRSYMLCQVMVVSEVGVATRLGGPRLARALGWLERDRRASVE